MGINKDANGYKYKMGINFYRLTADTDYTLCIEYLTLIANSGIRQK